MLIAITMGDANGVGPEILLKSFANGSIKESFIVIGDYSVLSFASEFLNYNIPVRKVESTEDVKDGYLNVLDMEILDRDDIDIGKVSKKAGYASIMYVEKATRLALEEKLNAIVTLPINKEAVRLTFPDFTGHTEFIANLCGDRDYSMMLASEKLIVTHLTTHIPLRSAIDMVKEENVYKLILLTYRTVERFIRNPKIAVAGLNPHAGEHSSFGREDEEEIKPAVDRARRDGIDVEGPVPPDTVFWKAYNGSYNAVVCMYHDQGHIPVKLLDFEGGVNITIGLKIVRTSVDHGTAYDIAYKGVASTRSLENAFRFAVRLATKNN
ncbi:TPA: 4-hydroxythreonine-4-phosphate dehydrogenase PdxA [bacterium]|jgi:4-hydroxythreonine-4-phosphate dehydrogenase|nr:4-hydroxythreonine-4-phosphate dehydrogenase PdxA [bacterium]